MTNISKPKQANNSDFVVGDTVVFIDATKPDHLMIVYQVQKNGVLLNGNNSFALNHLIRHATVFEVLEKKRHTTSIDDLFEVLGFGDDRHIENHISPRCENISNDEQIHLSKAFAAQKEVS
ncbi:MULTISPECIES: hypothetical protein [unclassified Acinetobacter]|jgi:hypothetical protein|uniref:hypothetical protein n=1 Tax=unclassified Acinetobacter TaxID=196816 RepID=UPI00148FFE69|nr:MULTISPECIES: hypothetical protein [unclassified Acinetobacter]NNP70828.1 hypothetical protein [Acinetobacter sp. Ac_5812]